MLFKRTERLRLEDGEAKNERTARIINSLRGRFKLKKIFSRILECKGNIYVLAETF